MYLQVAEFSRGTSVQPASLAEGILGTSGGIWENLPARSGHERFCNQASARKQLLSSIGPFAEYNPLVAIEPTRVADNYIWRQRPHAPLVAKLLAQQNDRLTGSSASSVRLLIQAVFCEGVAGVFRRFNRIEFPRNRPSVWACSAHTIV